MIRIVTIRRRRHNDYISYPVERRSSGATSRTKSFDVVGHRSVIVKWVGRWWRYVIFSRAIRRRFLLRSISYPTSGYTVETCEERGTLIGPYGVEKGSISVFPLYLFLVQTSRHRPFLLFIPPCYRSFEI